MERATHRRFVLVFQTCGVSMAESILPAHSLAEAYYYLSINPCPDCSTGVLDAGKGRRLTDVAGAARVEIETTCRSCGVADHTIFDLASDVGLSGGDDIPKINNSDERSRLIDVAQWLTLFRVTTEAAAREPDKQAARLKGIEAALCLEEALKFYDDEENDLPANDAFFSEETRQRFRDHPEQFSRHRLIEMRAKLPALDVMRRSALRRQRRAWWHFWG